MKRVADDCWEFEYEVERIQIYGMPEVLGMSPTDVGAYLSGCYDKAPDESSKAERELEEALTRQ